MDLIYTIIGTIASILGALISIFEAFRSKRYANEIKKIRDSIVLKRETIEVSNIHQETKSILDRISRIGPSSNFQTLRGIRLNEITSHLEKFILLLIEQRNHFNISSENIAITTSDQLKPLLEELSKAKEPKEIQEKGKQVYYTILTFLPFAKELVDSKKEKIN